MPEKAWKQQLNDAKKKACQDLGRVGYNIEPASNKTFCLTAMRDAEWRVIAIGTRPIVQCSWFIEQVRRLEKLPSPDPKTIKKEVWIKESGEQNFHKYEWTDGQWVNEDRDPVPNFN